MQRLVRHAEVRGDRFGAFAFERGEQTAQVPGQAGALPDVTEGFEVGKQEVTK